MENGPRWLADSLFGAAAEGACKLGSWACEFAGCVADGGTAGGVICGCRIRNARHPRRLAPTSNTPMAAKRRDLMAPDSQRVNRVQRNLLRHGSSRRDHRCAHAAKRWQ